MNVAAAEETLPSEAPTGELVLNRYRPICRLGRGGQADVFLAMTPGPADFHRLVVIKVLRDAARRGVGDVDSFLAEARLAARLNHPNVVQTFEVGEYRNQPCIVMEHLEGQSLDRVRHTAHKMATAPTDALWARIVTDALAGLTYAHELADYDRRPLNVVHRDISPQNIFVTYHGQVKVLDFGIAQANAPSPDTEEGIVKGKANYIAPEQAKDRQVDARADLFSLGIVFWELLTGVRLIKGDGAKAIYYLLHEPLPRVRDKRPDVDPQLDDIVARALEKDPARRYQSAAAMRQALEAYLEAHPAAPRTDDVAQLVQNLFDAQRDAVRRKIREFVSQGSDAEMVTGSHQWNVDSLRIPVLSTSLAPMQTGALTQAHPSSSRFWPVALVAVAALGAGAFWLSSRPAADQGAAAAQPAAASSVTIESEPAGARVEVDGQPAGATPLSLPIPTASTEIKLTAPGYQDARATLAAEDATSQLIVLAPAAGTAVASGEPETAEKKPTTRRRTARARPRRSSSTKAEPEAGSQPATPKAPKAAPPQVKVIEEEGPKVQVID